MSGVPFDVIKVSRYSRWDSLQRKEFFNTNRKLFLRSLILWDIFWLLFTTFSWSNNEQFYCTTEIKEIKRSILAKIRSIQSQRRSDRFRNKASIIDDISLWVAGMAGSERVTIGCPLWLFLSLVWPPYSRQQEATTLVSQQRPVNSVDQLLLLYFT